MTNLGTVKTPIDNRHKNTSEYIANDWKKLQSEIDVKLYSPSNGNTLFEERGSRSYQSK